MESEQRYRSWVDEVLSRGAVWIVGHGDLNLVIEDPDDDRDLNLLFSSRADAERHRNGAEVFAPIGVRDLPALLDRVHARGEGLALWHGDRWIVADAAPLAEELRERAG
jgi:hypothetical protein